MNYMQLINKNIILNSYLAVKLTFSYIVNILFLYTILYIKNFKKNLIFLFKILKCKKRHKLVRIGKGIQIFNSYKVLILKSSL